MANSLVLNGIEVPNLSDVVVHSAYKKVKGEVKSSLIDGWLRDSDMREATKRINLMKGSTYIGDAPYVDSLNTPPTFDNDSQAVLKSVEIPYMQFLQPIKPDELKDRAQQILMMNGALASTMELTYAQAYAICVQKALTVNAVAFMNRKRKMLAEVFTTGKLVINGTDYAKHRTIDFERDATATYVPALVWSNGAADVVGDIKAMINIYRDLNDRSPQVMIMRSDVYASMIANAAFKSEFITPYAGLSIPNLPGTLANDDRFGNLAMQLRGLSGGSLLDVWTYDANYTDKSGTKQYMLPQGGVYFTEYPSETSNFTARYAPIENFNALSYDAADAFTQILTKDDGKLVEVLSEQGFLVVPNNVNSVVGGANFV